MDSFTFINFPATAAQVEETGVPTTVDESGNGGTTGNGCTIA